MATGTISVYSVTDTSIILNLSNLTVGVDYQLKYYYSGSGGEITAYSWPSVAYPTLTGVPINGLNPGVSYTFFLNIAGSNDYSTSVTQATTNSSDGGGSITPDPTYYTKTITYSGMGNGLPSTSSITSTNLYETLYISTVIPYLSGYNFLNWQDTYGNSYSPGQSVQVYGNDTLQLYSTWQETGSDGGGTTNIYTVTIYTHRDVNLNYINIQGTYSNGTILNQNLSYSTNSLGTSFEIIGNCSIQAFFNSGYTLDHWVYRLNSIDNEQQTNITDNPWIYDQGVNLYVWAQSKPISTTGSGNVYVYYKGEWKPATPYVYYNGAWKPATPYVYYNGAWKPTK